MLLEKYVATYDNQLVGSEKTIVELKEKLKYYQGSNSYPNYKIFELKIKQVDNCYIPHEHIPEELKTIVVDPQGPVTLTE
jgi:hypothetical protein